jgi:hypothetical protein
VLLRVILAGKEDKKTREHTFSTRALYTLLPLRPWTPGLYLARYLTSNLSSLDVNGFRPTLLRILDLA